MLHSAEPPAKAGRLHSSGPYVKPFLRLCVGLGAVLLAAMLTGFQPLYWIVYLVLGGAVIAYGFTWLQSRGLDVTVEEVSAHPQVGGRMVLTVEVKEKFGFPRVALRSGLTGEALDAEEVNFKPEPSWVRTVDGVRFLPKARTEFRRSLVHAHQRPHRAFQHGEPHR